MIERRTVITADGSTTFYVPRWDEHYHSVHGAMQESEHVFIMAGLHFYTMAYPAVPERILEVGLGTGLNAWLTAMKARVWQRQVHYTALEAYPLTPAEAALLNYGSDDPAAQALLQQIHALPWGGPAELHPYMTLRKIQVTLESWQPDEVFDLIYFDAFAPDAQPELWTENIFRTLYNAAAAGAVLVTYAAKGAVRRAMKAAGWEVYKIPGPPGKREMTRAIRP